MIRSGLLLVSVTVCANLSSAQEFPVWERLLSHYSGKNRRDTRAVDENGKSHADVPERRTCLW